MNHAQVGLLVALAVLAAALLAPGQAAAELRLGGAGSALGMLRKLADRFNAGGGAAAETMSHSLGSTGGIKAVLAGALDVAVANRAPSATEQHDGARGLLIGHSPVLFVTSRTDIAPDISGELVVRLFGLRQMQWPDGMPAYVVLRPREEADFTLLAKHFGGMGQALHDAWAAPGRPHAYTAQDNLEMAARLPNSLAATSLTQLRTEHWRVTVLSLDGVAPTLDNLRSGAYPLAKPFYLVTTTHPGAQAKAFVQFVTSEAGRAVLSDSGILPEPG